LIYASGSTGRLKVSLFNTVRLSRSSTGRSGAAPDTSTLCWQPPDLFRLSISNSSRPEQRWRIILAQNALHLPQLLAAARVTLVNTVPSAVQELLHSDGLPDSVRVINLAGEPLPQSLVEQLYQRPTLEAVFDLYGPSETTTYSTHALRRAGGRATIGRPIGNTQIYLLGAHFQPVPSA
jgi:acyl-CoA synthetase (AMP-forming)/AMP-acid ligase II